MDQQSYAVEMTAANDTEQFAENIGNQLRGGEVIELIGDVGAGKTTFVRGLVRGTGSSDRVSSPTFTISNLYTSSGVQVHHYDFYRIEDVAIIRSELEEVLEDKKNVAVLEWAGSVQTTLPEDHIQITISVTGELGRSFQIVIPSKYDYIKVDA